MCAKGEIIKAQEIVVHSYLISVIGPGGIGSLFSLYCIPQHVFPFSRLTTELKHKPTDSKFLFSKGRVWFLEFLLHKFSFWLDSNWMFAKLVLSDEKPAVN